MTPRYAKKEKKKEKQNADMIGYVKEMRLCRVGCHCTEANVGILARLRV